MFFWPNKYFGTQKIGPAGLEPPAGARKRRKASVTKLRNTAPWFNTLDPIFESYQNT